jgi:CRP-like cAMP-binding protein/L-amino acid N-acyltransferase YncA
VTPTLVEQLGSLAVLEGCPTDRLADLARQLHLVTVGDHDAVMSEGEPGSWFVLVVEGSATVIRGGREVETAAPGSILGELSLLRGSPRAATVVATSPVTALLGGAEAFEALLELPGVRERLARTVAQRLARSTRPVETALADGRRVWLRPILPSDREGLVVGLERLSPESRYQRFFTPVKVSESLLRYMSDIDYLDHFAWVVAVREGEGQAPVGIASARYIREAAEPSVAEIALEVVDDHQGRGVGRLLMGALAAAASIGGVEHFRAFVQEGNRPMRALLDRAGAEWTRAEPGVVETLVRAADLAGGVDETTFAELRDAARTIVSAASLALA